MFLWEYSGWAHCSLFLLILGLSRQRGPQIQLVIASGLGNLLRLGLWMWTIYYLFDIFIYISFIYLYYFIYYLSTYKVNTIHLVLNLLLSKILLALYLLRAVHKLPVHHHPADQHEEEHQGGRHPLKRVINSKVGVEVEHLGHQQDDVGSLLHLPVGDQKENKSWKWKVNPVLIISVLAISSLKIFRTGQKHPNYWQQSRRWDARIRAQ